MRILDLDSGDLGITKYVHPLHELPIVIEIASKILLDAKKLIPDLNGNKKLSYCIGLDCDNSKLAMEIIEREKRNLPDGIQFYDVDGRSIFELRGASGGKVSMKVCYLVIK